MRYPFWEPLNRLHIPVLITVEQANAMRSLYYAAMERGGILDYRSNIKHEERAGS